MPIMKSSTPYSPSTRPTHIHIITILPTNRMRSSVPALAGHPYIEFPAIVCPTCREPANAITELENHPGWGFGVREGDIGVCLYCGQIYDVVAGEPDIIVQPFPAEDWTLVDLELRARIIHYVEVIKFKNEVIVEIVAGKRGLRDLRMGVLKKSSPSSER